MVFWFDVLLDGMSNVIGFMKSIEIFDGVSLWSFILSALLIGAIFNVLVNVVASYGVYRYDYPYKEAPDIKPSIGLPSGNRSVRMRD